MAEDVHVRHILEGQTTGSLDNHALKNRKTLSKGGFDSGTRRRAELHMQERTRGVEEGIRVRRNLERDTVGARRCEVGILVLDRVKGNHLRLDLLERLDPVHIRHGDHLLGNRYRRHVLHTLDYK